MSKLKELFSDTIIYGISRVLARFINYLLVPFHTDVFRPDAYGIIGLVYAGIAFLNVIFTFGMESAYLRYAKDRDHAKNVFKTLQVGLLGGATVFALFLYFAAPALMPLMKLGPGSSHIYLLMIGILWFDTLSLVPFAELRLVRKSILYSVIHTIHVFINLGLNFYLILVLDWGIEAVFTANLAASVFSTVVLWLLTSDMLKGNWDRSILRKAFSFGWPFIPAGIGFAINEMLDRFFLGNYLSEDVIFSLYGTDFSPESIVGIYSACYKVAVFMLLFVQMFRLAWQPFFLRHAEDPNAGRLFGDIFRYYNMAAAFIFLSVALFVDKIVQIPIPLLNTTLIDEQYWMGLDIVPLLLGAYWFHGWYMNFSAGIFIREETKIFPQITLIGAGVTIIANLALIPFLGMSGSALATLFSYGTMALLLYHRSKTVFPVPYSLARGFGMLAIAGAAILIKPYLAENFALTEWSVNFLLLFLSMAGVTLLGVKRSGQ